MKLKEIDLFITEKCNLSCQFCSINAGPSSLRELDFETVSNFVKYAKKNGVTDIHITGGEPTLHKNYKDIISLIISQNIETRLITNGLLLSKVDLCELSKIGLKNIMFSLDGLEDFHDTIRGKKTFKKTLLTIQMAIEQGFNVRVNTVAWNENLDSIINLMKLLNGIGVNLYSVFLGSPVGRAKHLRNLSVIEDDVWYRFLKEMKREYLNEQLLIKIVVEQGFVMREKKKIDYNAVRSCTSILENTEYLTIRADGNIYPCVFFNEDYQNVGNIYNLERLDINRNLKNNKYYHSVSELPKDCELCNEKNYCQGGCRGFHSLTSEVFKDTRCHQNCFIPICPLIKMDLLSDVIAPCTDDLS